MALCTCWVVINPVGSRVYTGEETSTAIQSSAPPPPPRRKACSSYEYCSCCILVLWLRAVQFSRISYPSGKLRLPRVWPILESAFFFSLLLTVFLSDFPKGVVDSSWFWFIDQHRTDSSRCRARVEECPKNTKKTYLHRISAPRNTKKSILHRAPASTAACKRETSCAKKYAVQTWHHIVVARTLLTTV